MTGRWQKLLKSLSAKFSLRSNLPNSSSLSSESRSCDADPKSSPEPTCSSGSKASSSAFSRFSRSFSSPSSKKTCAICLGSVKIGQGQAIFTAECSHSFHFKCIANSVKHGNRVCPICRSKWKDVPVQLTSGNGDPQHNGTGRARVSPYQVPAEDHSMSFSRPLSSPPSYTEPVHFSDDEPLPVNSADPPPLRSPARSQSVTIKAVPEFPAIACSDCVSSFAILVGLRAPPLLDGARHLERAPIDLVTVLDVSSSMFGSKLALLKRAVRFVIENLGPVDRLSIVTFSSSARRIFPLRRMSDGGREDAVQAIDSLSSNGGTNIVEGLKKAVRVLQERCERNPVTSIILLSDGRDTHNCDVVNQRYQASKQNNVLEYLNLLPASIWPSNAEATNEARPSSIAVHTFGFGSDHDSAAMHAISDASGGTFSFIETVGMVQDSFARCIGGLLSVVAQQVRLTMTSAYSGVQIGSIPSGRYRSEVSEQEQKGVIDVGDLYADEEKEFLVYLSVPVVSAAEGGDEMVKKMALLDVCCSYRDTLSKEMVHSGVRIEIERPEVLSPADMAVSLEVDRQRNRLWVAEGIAEAQEMAERGNLEVAQAVLTSRRSTLLQSASAQAGDALCNWLEAELTEIRERMASKELYEHTGRAYVLSGLSSHSWQRATTRGDSATHSMVLTTENGNSSNAIVTGYDTPSMVTMVSKSQTLTYSMPAEQA